MAPLYVLMNVAGQDFAADIPFYTLMALKFFGQVYSSSTSSYVWDL